jgi:hypothetical protein
VKVSELLVELEELKAAYGDLDVHVWADHGQQCTDSFSCGIQWVDKDGDVTCEEDLDDPEEELCKEDYTQVIEIAG